MTEPHDWIYLKLHLGAQARRADALLADLGRRMSANPHLERWFYLRFVDEDGFHIRLRALPIAAVRQAALARLEHDCTDMLDHIYDYVPGTYEPMVRLPDYLVAEPPAPTGRVRFTTDRYAPEYEKFGQGGGMAAAEALFHASSVLASRILAAEAAGQLSRKTIAPWLMHAVYDAFPSVPRAEFWRQYSFYWLGGESPAAQDWRDRFARKAAALQASGIALRDADALGSAGHDIQAAWEAGLADAAAAYGRLPAHEQGRTDVLCLNFAHLMLNRLGIATLEEAYLATLLEAFEQVPA